MGRKGEQNGRVSWTPVLYAGKALLVTTPYLPPFHKRCTDPTLAPTVNSELTSKDVSDLKKRESGLG